MPFGKPGWPSKFVKRFNNDAMITQNTEFSEPQIGSEQAHSLTGAILAFGLDRSGTSWVGKLLDSHPDTLYRHEPDSECPLASVPIAPNQEAYSEFEASTRNYLTSVADVRCNKVSGKLPLFRKRYRSAWRAGAQRGVIGVSRLASHFGLTLQVPDLIDPKSRANSRIVWKSIESLGRLGLFLHCLDECRAVVVIRHPCGQIASLLRAPWQYDASVDREIYRQLLTSKDSSFPNVSWQTIQNGSQVERLAWRWALYNDKALTDTANDERVMVLEYDQLCQRTTLEVQSMFAFCDLDWNDQTAAFVQNSTTQHSKRYFSVYKDPRKTCDAWKQQLTDAQINSIRRVTRDTKSGQLFADSF